MKIYPAHPKPHFRDEHLAIVGWLRLLQLRATRITGVDPNSILMHFTSTLGENTDEAVVATENIFFTLRSAAYSNETFAKLLASGQLAPRPAAILLARVWHTGNTSALDGMVVPLFRAARDAAGDVLMHRGWPLYTALPDSFTVYRGSRNRSTDEAGASWTLYEATARIFASVGIGDDPGRILAAEIDKADALALFNVMGEGEIVVDSSGLRNVRTLEDDIARTGRSALGEFLKMKEAEGTA